LNCTSFHILTVLRISSSHPPTDSGLAGQWGVFLQVEGPPWALLPQLLVEGPPWALLLLACHSAPSQNRCSALLEDSTELLCLVVVQSMIMTEWATLLVALASGGADDAQVVIDGGAEGSDIPWWTCWALCFRDNIF